MAGLYKEGGPDSHDERMRDLDVQYKQAQIDALNRRGMQGPRAPVGIDPAEAARRERGLKLREEQFAANQADPQAFRHIALVGGRHRSPLGYIHRASAPQGR